MADCPTFTIAQFRASFPEFADDVRYPNNIITLWSDLAIKFVDCERWGECYIMGVSLYTAHSLVLATDSALAAQIGGLPGGRGGAISSKSVGSASVSFDTSDSSEANAGHWNQTQYGRQYIHLVQLIGQGCYQLCSRPVGMAGIYGC